jgi:hypothetical protein
MDSCVIGSQRSGYMLLIANIMSTTELPHLNILTATPCSYCRSISRITRRPFSSIVKKTIAILFGPLHTTFPTTRNAAAEEQEKILPFYQ